MAVRSSNRRRVFETERLYVVVGNAADTEFFYRLWTNPAVMRNVGFPQGLPVTREEIADQLRQQEAQILDARLVVRLHNTDQRIGECKLGAPDQNKLSTTDVKLLPQFWGHRYGVEIKKGLLDYLFRYTDCQVVEASPNIENIASIKMQEKVGGKRMGEYTWEPPPEMCEFAQPVHSYIYHVTRDTWLATQQTS